MGEEKEAENVVHDLLSVKYSRKANIPLYTLGILLIIAIVYLNYIGVEIPSVIIGGALALIIVLISMTEISRIKHLYQINPVFLIHSQGIATKRVKKVALSSISDMDLRQNIWQRILGYGNIHVNLFAEKDSIRIRNISKPHEFIDFLEKQMANKKE